MHGLTEEGSLLEPLENEMFLVVELPDILLCSLEYNLVFFVFVLYLPCIFLDIQPFSFYALSVLRFLSTLLLVIHYSIGNIQ